MAPARATWWRTRGGPCATRTRASLARRSTCSLTLRKRPRPRSRTSRPPWSTSSSRSSSRASPATLTTTRSPPRGCRSSSSKFSPSSAPTTRRASSRPRGVGPAVLTAGACVHMRVQGQRGHVRGHPRLPPPGRAARQRRLRCGPPARRLFNESGWGQEFTPPCFHFLALVPCPFGGRASAVVYECICTITRIYPSPQLVEIAARSVGRFLRSENNNLKYLGITALAAIVMVRASWRVPPWAPR